MIMFIIVFLYLTYKNRVIVRWPLRAQHYCEIKKQVAYANRQNTSKFRKHHQFNSKLACDTQNTTKWHTANTQYNHRMCWKYTQHNHVLKIHKQIHTTRLNTHNTTKYSTTQPNKQTYCKSHKQWKSFQGTQKFACFCMLQIHCSALSSLGHRIISSKEPCPTGSDTTKLLWITPEQREKLLCDTQQKEDVVFPAPLQHVSFWQSYRVYGRHWHEHWQELKINLQ